MAQSRQWEFGGTRGTIVVREWPNQDPRYVALLAHGYGEHIGRYEHVADALVTQGAAVYGPDHMGHGESAGERVLITDYEEVVTDLHAVQQRARTAHPDTPIVLIGHSMGGMIAARYAQRYGSGLAALVLSGPVLGSWNAATSLLDLDEIPFEPIDVSTLSRDPEVGRIYSEDPLVWHGPFKRTTLAAIDRCLDTINAGDRLGPLPTLWVHGADDRLVPMDETSGGIDQIRGDSLVSIDYPDAQHEVFNETNGADVIADVTAFLDRALAGRPPLA